MQDVTNTIKTSISFLKRILGFVEFRKIDPGESYDGQRFYAIRAIDGDLTFSVTTSKGDNISSSIISQDTNIVGTFESIEVDGGSSGSAIIYLS